MKKIIIISLIVISTFFITKSSFAYDACDTNQEPSVLPCTIGTEDYDSYFWTFYFGNKIMYWNSTETNITIDPTTNDTFYIEDLDLLERIAHYSYGSLTYINGSSVDYSWMTESEYSWYLYEEVQTIGITNLTPVHNANNVNAYTQFTGTYDNDGLYDTVLIKILNMDNVSAPSMLLVCEIDLLIGTGIPYSCSTSLNTNTNYSFDAWLWWSECEINECLVLDEDGPYLFTTGTVYEPITPPTSSTCGALEFGCHLENALGWFFGVDQSTLNQFANLSLSSRFPFSYLTDIKNLFNDLFDAESQNFDISIDFHTFGEITLISTAKLQAIPFQGLVRSIMGTLMVFGAVLIVYRKIIGIHDANHKTHA